MKKRAIIGLMVLTAILIGIVPSNGMHRAPPGASIVQITSPTNGATVSGTVTIELSKSADIYIDEVKVASGVSSYNWDTTAYADGSHVIQAQGSRGYDADQISVTVNNGGSTPEDNPPVVLIESPASGATVSDTVSIQVSVTDEDSLTADIYIDGSYVISANSYSWDTTAYADGVYSIYAEATDSASQTGSDEISVTVDNSGSGEEPPSGGDGIVNKYAVIVGISDYEAISDLSYCDEDANDMYAHFNSLGYEVEVYGDHTNSYTHYTGLATEANVKSAVANMINKADEDDIIVFITSGHGGAYTNGPPHSRYQYLCMWDTNSGEDGEDGIITDTEFQNMFASIVSRTFIFIDHCYAGGMNEVMNVANSHLIYMATTCTDNGYGYDYPSAENGAWTHYFLEVAWQQYYGGSATVSMEDVFAYAHSVYPYGGGDEPQQFDGNTGSYFYVV